MTDRDIDALIEASSLGTPDAKAMRDRTSDEVARRCVERAKEIADEEKDGEPASPLVDRTRRAVVSIGDETIARLLHLPDGMVVLGVSSDWATMSIQVMVAGPQLDPIVECAEPRQLLATITEDGDTGAVRLGVLMPGQEP